ncbi:hypothetical protein BD413DRAFT_277633 [Trametes elegans]|nr:hypothetical protein BD413DRAFT_277633 [Trametes elegans]
MYCTRRRKDRQSGPAARRCALTDSSSSKGRLWARSMKFKWLRLLRVQTAAFQRTACRASTLDHTIKTPEGLYRTRTNLALVSKRFASFAEPLALLNAFPFRGTHLVEKLDERLKRRTELAHHIRVLALPDFFDYVYGRPSFRQEYIQVVDWDLPGLRLCCGFLFGTLSRSGPPVLRKFPASLRTLKLFGDALSAMGLCLDSSPCLSVDLFSDAHNLTTLVLDGHLLRVPECPTPPEVLSRLTKLVLNMQNGYDTTTCLATLDLPSLEEVQFHNLGVTVQYVDPCAILAIFSFCQKHGAKLKRLTIGGWRDIEPCDERILDLCPRLETLSIFSKLDPRLLKPQQLHRHLRCIDFTFCGSQKICETDVDMMLNLLFDGAGSTMLVALEEFRLERGSGCFPDSELSGPNEPLERFARELRARYPHIHLADACGRRWGRF